MMRSVEPPGHIEPLGIDGCPAGWVAASHAGVFIDARLERLLDRLCPTVVAIDMPIGLAETGPRACDQAARALLGAGRASSVFSPPVRAALAGTTHRETSALNASRCGKRVSIQAFNLVPKLREIDGLLNDRGDWRARVFETHPEISFCAMNNGVTLAQPKRRAPGRARRRGLVEAHFGTGVMAAARERLSKRDAADDDIADAFACLFTAERIAAGQHVELPSPPPPRDATGLPMRICY